MAVNIVILVVFILLSAFFSGAETAIFSLGLSRIRRLNQDSKNVRKLKRLLKKPGYLLATIVFGNMLVNIGLSSFNTTFFVQIFQEKGALFSILFSGIVILFFGEIFPKSIAINAAARLAVFSAPVLIFIEKIFSPFLHGIQRLSEKLSSLVTTRKKAETAVTEDELKTALLLGKKDGVITEAEEDMIFHLLKFKETAASQIVTHRMDLKGIDYDMSQEEVLNFLKEFRHSKFPVYKESIDHINGILYAKDVFLNPTQDWKLSVREAFFVPEAKKIDDILKEFIATEKRIAVVLDEYGGTLGVLSFEDIVEEIFGEIYDEYEKEQELVIEIGKDKYRVSGKTPVKTVNLEMDINLPEDEEDTIAGFLISRLERIPEVDEKFKIDGVNFYIERASRKRLISIIISL